MEFNAEIALGNSGGPLIDKAGRMVGMVTFIEEGRGYALQMNLVLSIVEVWLKRIRLEKKWQHQRYATTWERTYKDLGFIAGEAAILGGIVALTVLSKDDAFPLPPSRPDGK